MQADVCVSTCIILSVDISKDQEDDNENVFPLQ
jgi:hypothetical protein